MRITESKLRSIIRSVIIESSKPALKKKEEVIDKFNSVVDSELEKKIKIAIDRKEEGKISNIAMVLGRKLRGAYRKKYKIDSSLSHEEFKSGVNKGLSNYISNLEKKLKELDIS